jgi:hypothetical protein
MNRGDWSVGRPFRGLQRIELYETRALAAELKETRLFAGSSAAEGWRLCSLPSVMWTYGKSEAPPGV